eukprot:sb/3475931/
MNPEREGDIMDVSNKQPYNVLYGGAIPHLILKLATVCSDRVGGARQITKQPIRTRYLGHVTGYQPIWDQHFLIRSVPALLQLITFMVEGGRCVTTGAVLFCLAPPTPSERTEIQMGYGAAI